MKRTVVQLDEDIYRKLRQKAFQQERSISSLVREMVAQGLGAGTRREKQAHGTKLLSVAAGRSRQGTSPVSERHDEAFGSIFYR